MIRNPEVKVESIKQFKLPSNFESVYEEVQESIRKSRLAGR